MHETNNAKPREVAENYMSYVPFSFPSSGMPSLMKW